jgi:CheY-like chemotaxis protein
MLSNLVGNAIKFTERGQVIVEGCELARETRQDATWVRLRFTVTDTGIGIPADKIDYLFQPFSQVDASNTRRFGGTGLGLSIVRSLAERMGGTVGVESTENRGARFWFEIEVEAVGHAREMRAVPRVAEETLVDTAHEPLGRVLLVEDNPVNRLVVERMLVKHGIAVTCATDGAQAVEIFHAGAADFDAILMDMQMPVMDGAEATRQIRAHEAREAGGRIPIIALTASVFEKDRELCQLAGMDDFLAKPVNANQLLLTIDKWLAMRRA